VLDEDGRFLCRLQREDLMRFALPGDPDAGSVRDQVGGFIANRNGLRKAVRESTAALNRRVMAGGYATLEEQSRQRLQLPRAVGDGLAGSVVQKPARPEPDGGAIKQTHSEDNVARYLAQRMGGAHGAL
jgi:hypothetical protein